MEEKMYTVEETAELINKSERTVRDYCSNGKTLPGAVKDAGGREWAIPKSAIDKFLGNAVTESEAKDIIENDPDIIGMLKENRKIELSNNKKKLEAEMSPEEYRATKKYIEDNIGQVVTEEQIDEMVTDKVNEIVKEATAEERRTYFKMITEYREKLDSLIPREFKANSIIENSSKIRQRAEEHYDIEVNLASEEIGRKQALSETLSNVVTRKKSEVNEMQEILDKKIPDVLKQIKEFSATTEKNSTFHYNIARADNWHNFTQTLTGIGKALSGMISLIIRQASGEELN